MSDLNVSTYEPLLGPRLKLERASHHLSQIAHLEQHFFTSNSPRLVFDTESKPGHKLVKIVLEAKPPELVHVLTGELIYQLRSTLDQIAVEFARLSKGPTRPKDVYFPTGDSFKGFVSSCKSYNSKKKRLTGNLRHFDADLRKAILKTRPYSGGNETLRAVFQMANIDKHMELIAIGAAGGLAAMSDFNIVGGYTGLMLTGPGDLSRGVVISDLKPHGSITPKHANAQIQFSGKITLGDNVPYAHQPLVQFLNSMLQETKRVYASLRALLDRRT